MLERAESADDYPPLPEPQYHAVVGGGGAGEVHDGLVVLAEGEGGLTGFALVTPARDGSNAIHVVIDPARSDDGALASDLVRCGGRQRHQGR